MDWQTHCRTLCLPMYRSRWKGRPSIVTGLSWLPCLITLKPCSLQVGFFVLCFFVLNFFSFWEGGEEGVLLNNKSFFQEMSVMFRLKLINTQVQSHWLPVDGTPFHIMFTSSAYVGTYFKLGNLIKIQLYTIVQIKRRKIWHQSIEGHVLWHQNELQLPLVWPNKGNPINQS